MTVGHSSTVLLCHCIGKRVIVITPLALIILKQVLIVGVYSPVAYKRYGTLVHVIRVPEGFGGSSSHP